MNNKTKKIIWMICGILPSLMVGLSAVMKLSRGEEVVKGFTAMGLIDYLTILGIMEIVILILLWIPKTYKLGLFLITAYLGGAIATELAHGRPPFLPALFIALFWLSAFIRDSSNFLVKE